jgi:glyoxylase-like metal-dependent hydrolase (beta-lactamase superfamily II)
MPRHLHPIVTSESAGQCASLDSIIIILKGKKMHVNSIVGSERLGITLLLLEGLAGALIPISAFAVSPVIAINNEAKTANVSVTPLRDGISVLMGSGGNVTVLKSPSELLMIDGGISFSKDSMMRALSSISSAPPKYLINTHYHWDHADGNAWIAKLGATIIAHDNTLKRLSVDTRVDDWEWTFPASPVEARPTVLFADHKAIKFHGKTVELKYYGACHTDSDIWAYVVESDVLVTGDTWWNGYYPFIDNENGGSIDGMVRAANDNISKVTDHTIVVPGHGPIGGRADLIEYRDMLIGIRNKVAALKAKGASRSDAVAAKPTAAYDAKWGGFVIDPAFFTRLVYDGL